MRRDPIEGPPIAMGILRSRVDGGCDGAVVRVIDDSLTRRRPKHDVVPDVAAGDGIAEGRGDGLVLHGDDKLGRAATKRKDFFGFFFRMGKRAGFTGVFWGLTGRRSRETGRAASGKATSAVAFRKPNG